MLQYFWKGYADRDLGLMHRVQQEDDRVDTSCRGIKDYLSRIQEGLSEQEKRWQLALFTFSNELESVGDLIEKSLCDFLRKQAADGTFLPNPDFLAPSAAAPAADETAQSRKFPNASATP